MLLSHGTVIALVDGKNFELYRNAGNEAAPELESMPAPKLDTANHSSAGHHSHPGNHANAQVMDDVHADAVSHWLNSQVLGHKIDKIVVIAPPKTLGELRRHYHKQTEKAVVKELHKDLIGKKAPEILAALREKN